MTAHDVRCGDCGAAMALRAGRFRPFYSCTRYPACRGAHGAHPAGRRFILSDEVVDTIRSRNYKGVQETPP